MKYTINDTAKKYGVILQSKITQANQRNYKLVDAVDIDWNSSIPDSDPNVVINTTEDLINWIDSKTGSSGNNNTTRVKTASVTLYKNVSSVNSPIGIPDVLNAYDFNNNMLFLDKKAELEAEGWRLSPNFATSRYIWCSQNNYTENGSNYYETGWSIPQRYYNVQELLTNATNAAQSRYDQYIQDGGETLQQMLDRYNNALNDSNDLLNQATSNSLIAKSTLTAAQKLLADIQTGDSPTAGLISRLNDVEAQLNLYGWNAANSCTFGSYTVKVGSEVKPSEMFGTEWYYYNDLDLTLKCTEIDPVNHPGIYGLQVIHLDNTYNQDTEVFWESDEQGTRERWFVNGYANIPTDVIFSTSDRYALFKQTDDYDVLLKSEATDSVKYSNVLIDAINNRIVTELVNADLTNNVVFSNFTEDTANSFKKTITTDNLDAKISESTTIKQISNLLSFTATQASLNALSTDISELSVKVGEIEAKVEERDDDSIKLSFLKLLSGLISAGVYTEKNGSVDFSSIAATPENIRLAIGDDKVKQSLIDIAKNQIELAVDGTSLRINDNGLIEIIAKELIVTGEMIAQAIATNGITIQKDGQNVTTITNEGDVTIGIGTPGLSHFDHNGTGYIANGAISWGTGEINKGCTFSGTVASKFKYVTLDDVIKADAGTTFIIETATGDYDPAEVYNIVDIQYTGNQIYLDKNVLGATLIDLPSFAYNMVIDGEDVNQKVRGFEGTLEFVLYMTWAMGFVGSVVTIYTRDYSNKADEIGENPLYIRGVIYDNDPTDKNYTLEPRLLKDVFKGNDLEYIANGIVTLQCILEMVNGNLTIYWEPIYAGHNVFGVQSGMDISECESKNTTHYV